MLAQSSLGSTWGLIEFRWQVAIFGATCLLVAVSFYVLGSPLLLLLPVGVAALVWILKTPFRSVCAYIAITDILTIRPKPDTGVDGAPTALDLLMGVLLAILAIYWIFKIKLWDQSQLSVSRSHLLMILFFVWSVPLTVAGALVYETSLNAATRELLNLMPLLILPVLYGRYIKPNSREETIILWMVVVSGVLVVLSNIYVFRSNVVRAYYLYQTGRAALDLALTCLIAFTATSLLMLRLRWWQSLGAIFLLLLALVGLAISMTRTLYIGVALGMLLVLWLGRGEERRRGVGSLFKAGWVMVAAAIPVFLTSRIIRLLVTQFGLRFLTTRRAAHDPSLLNRFVEWKAEWLRTLESPVFGHGFGAQFKFYNIVTQHHDWLGFSHNSYLYILFKSGFVGGILFFAACLGLILKSFAVGRREGMSNRSRMVLRASIASIVIQLFGAFTGPTFDSKAALVWLGITWGVVAALDLSTQTRRVPRSDEAILDHGSPQSNAKTLL